jgi:chromosome segregation ATPase
MEGMVSIVGFGDDNAMAKLEERTGLELQEDPHKQTADVLSGQNKCASMEDNGSHNVNFPPRMEWGEIDTTAPFESVKAAVTLFGEGAFGDKADGKRLKLPVGERRIAKETELHRAKKELDKFKEQLKNAETTKAQALLELEEAKKVVEDLTQKLEKAKESKEKASEVTEIARLRAEELDPANTKMSKESNTVWQAELNVARESHIKATDELDAAKQELRKVKQELAASMETKALAVKQAEEATIAAEMNTRMVEELKKEIATTNESLVLVKLACIEAEKERINILAEKDAEAQQAAATIEQSRKQLEALRQESNATKYLEAKLAATMTAVENLEKEIILAKESQSKVAKAASNANDKLAKVKSEIEKVKHAAPVASSSLESLSVELEEAKESMLAATQKESTLRVCMDSLRIELEQVRKELAELKQKEEDAEAAAASLNAGLHKSQSTLAAAAAAEMKAKDATSGLSLALEQLATETQEARKEAEAMKEEAKEAKLKAEQAKAALNTTESRFQAALKEADAAKAAEKIALGRIKALSEKTNAARASTSESGAAITVSQDEYDSLNRSVAEADELANMKVAAAMAQVDAVKAAEQELLMKLEVANREIEEIKTASEQALHRAEMAEAAKRAVEGELRRWRENEQRKRAVVSAAAQDYINNEKNVISRSSIEKSVHSEPLGKVLNIKIASPERVERVQSVNGSFSLKKKKQLIPNIGGIFTKKKNHLDGNSPH